MHLADTLAEFFKLQKILGNEILLPEFTSCCCLSENAGWPFFLPKTTFLTLRTFPISRKFELVSKENSSFSSHFHQKIIGDNRFSEQIFTETVCWVPLEFE